MICKVIRCYQLICYFGYDVRIVHSFPVVRPNGRRMHARLAVPVRKKIINFIMSHGFHRQRGALTDVHVCSYTFYKSNNKMRLIL